MISQPNKTQFIGGKIREAREAAAVSQKTLADAVGFESATAISLIEKGERKLRVEDLEKIAAALNRDIKYFLGYENKPADVRVALRADKDLTDSDKQAILRFVQLAKDRKHAGRRNT